VRLVLEGERSYNPPTILPEIVEGIGRIPALVAREPFIVDMENVVVVGHRP